VLKKIAATVALSAGVVLNSGAAAMACFPADGGGGDCVKTTFIVCSVNADGTGA
jgi:hypothetical protein